jgi:hypothetical protein
VAKSIQKSTKGLQTAANAEVLVHEFDDFVIKKESNSNKLHIFNLQNGELSTEFRLSKVTDE